MAKPIFVLTIRGYLSGNEFSKINESLTAKLGNDYHVLVAVDHDLPSSHKAECFNDCKGLQDIDIEKLIKDFTK